MCALSSNLEGNAICCERLDLDGGSAHVVEILVKELYASISLQYPRNVLTKPVGLKSGSHHWTLSRYRRMLE
jgi:hypothetical protein